MNDQLYAEAETLFHAVVELSSEARQAILAKRCHGNEELRILVERLLDSQGAIGDFLESPILAGLPIAEPSTSASAEGMRIVQPTFPSGTRLAERYRVKQLLGRGGGGEVYEALDEDLSIPVALKTFRFAKDQERIALRQLKQEAILARSIVHPNICRVLDITCHGQGEDAAWFFTMEVLRGETLRDRLRSRGRLTPVEALPLVQQMAAGLEAAHQAGVIHGDFKSGNVMLVDGPEGELAVITDFGLSRKTIDEAAETDRNDERRGIAGTLAYMAPEQLQGKKFGPAADIYAMGVVLYEMVTASLPFTGTTLWQGAMRRLEEPPASPRSVVPDLEKRWEMVILRCMSREPRERFQSAQEVADALTRTEEGRHSAHATPEALPKRTLPPERDAFVGRHAELEDLGRRFMDGARLVTLVGAAGMGKTRLAIHYGGHQPAAYPGGVWFCDVTQARNLNDIAASVAEALGVELGRGDPVTQVGHAIAGRKRCLVIFDNFDQVVEHANQTLTPWLDRATAARFLVTSRECLHLPAEETQTIESLGAEPSLALFVDRARRLRPGLRLEGIELSSAKEVVRLVDGMPLAIELASARLRMMSAERLVAAMHKRFRLLTGGPVSRHETLAAALDGSWNLLQPWEKAVFAQSAVFEGGFILGAAEQVIHLDAWPEAPSVVDVIQSLVDKSLLRIAATSGDGTGGRPEPRFNMYASVVEYAREKLAEEGAIERGGSGALAVRSAEDRHGQWFSRYGSQDVIVAGATSPVERDAFKYELENLLAACRRARARADGRTAVATYWASVSLFLSQRPAEAVVIGRELLEMPLQPFDRANLLRRLATAESFSGNLSDAWDHHQMALGIYQLLGERRFEGQTLVDLGVILQRRDQSQEAQKALESALAIMRDMGSRLDEARALHNMGVVQISLGRMDEACSHLEEALTILREDRSRTGLGSDREGGVLRNLGVVYYFQSRFDVARSHWEAALAIDREVGNRRSEAGTLTDLGSLCVEQRQFDLARLYLEAALAIYLEMGDRYHEGVVRTNLGNLEEHEGRMDEARTHYETALTIFREMKTPSLEAKTLANLGGLHFAANQKTEAWEKVRLAESILRKLVDDVDRGHRSVDMYSIDLGKFLCFRARLEWDSGESSQAASTLVEAESLAVHSGQSPTSGLGRSISEMRAIIEGKEGGG